MKLVHIYNTHTLQNSDIFRNIKLEYLQDEEAQNILKLIYNFEEILKQVTEKNEPSILSRYLIDVAKAYSSYYNNNKIIVEDTDIKNARIFITYATGKILEIGASLLGMKMPDKM